MIRIIATVLAAAGAVMASAPAAGASEGHSRDLEACIP